MESIKEIDNTCNEFPFVGEEEGPFVFNIKEEEIDVTDDQVNVSHLLSKTILNKL